MAAPHTHTVECDILIIGGGMSGCGAAFEARYWGKDLRVVVVEKAVIERSGATGEGLSAINCYLGQRYGWNTPEDFVKYVVNDMMGLAREDLVYDVGRHVDSSVHLLEEWGLPIWKQDNGQYERIGRWQIPIHGESIKPITAEPARKALGQENIYERVAVTHLLTDANDAGRIAGAIGFAVRENAFYVFKATAIIIACGGSSNVFRPRSIEEGLGRTWYSVFATGAAAEPRHQADPTAARRPAEVGGARPAQVAALLGALAPHLGGRGPHAAPAPPPGNPLAGLLLPRRFTQVGRHPLARLRQLPLPRRPRHVGAVHEALHQLGQVRTALRGELFSAGGERAERSGELSGSRPFVLEKHTWNSPYHVHGRALCNEGMAGDDIPHFRRKEA